MRSGMKASRTGRVMQKSVTEKEIDCEEPAL